MVNENGTGSGIQSRFKSQHIVALVLLVVVIGALITIFFLQRGQAVATVNGEKITRDELYDAMYSQVGKDALDDLITRRLILQEGKELGLSISEAEIDEEIDRIVQENFMGMIDQFEQLLEQHGMTLAAVRNDAKVNLMARKIAMNQIEISDHELKEYFVENQDGFNIPDQVEARHILVDTEEEALAVINLLNGGADFAELAKERSKDPESKDNGGSLSFFKPGDMLPEFDEVAFSLKIGEISEPVETFYGFHVIEVLNQKKGRAVTFDEVKEQVYETMIEDKIYGLIQEMITRLRAEANIIYR